MTKTDSREKILVVEDHRPQALIVARWLEASRGAAVTVAEDAEEAYDLLEAGSWDLVITDFLLPGEDGVRLSAEVKKRVPDTPVMMVTAHPSIDVAVGALRSRADDFLTKPLNRNELLQRAAKLLGPLPTPSSGAPVSSGRAFAPLQDGAEGLDAVVEGWARALDLRDHETEGHSRRVTDLTLRLGRAMGMEDDTLVHLRRGALLHDIGKIGIPDAILLKPGALDPSERAVMERHPVYGKRLLEPIPELRPALDVVYGHHERWDGRGYPDGLERAEIPLGARLFAVVDVWDALTSDRPYRKAWTKQRVVEYLEGEAGRQFDPQVVACFLDMMGRDRTAAE